MAVLDPKESVLRLLDPQPADGTGPGYISALDLKTVCSNLYDQVERVNGEVTALPAATEITDMAESMAILQSNRADVVAELLSVDATAITVADLVQILVRGTLDDYVQIPLLPGAEISDEEVLGQIEVNFKYGSDIPVSWGSLVVTINSVLYSWNGYYFVEVSSAPAGPDPFAIVPGDSFRAQGLHALTAEDLFEAGLRGDDSAWASQAVAFTLVGPGENPRSFVWTPSDVDSAGFFTEVE